MQSIKRRVAGGGLVPNTHGLCNRIGNLTLYDEVKNPTWIL